MEPFVRAIVAGGIAAVAGLWIVDWFEPGAPAWLLGPPLIVVGGGLLLYGLAKPLELAR